MIINLRKLDYILIVIILVLYIITTITESITGFTFMRYLSPILILIFVIVYLQTIRSLEQEIKRVKQLSKKEILESVNVVDTKLGESLSLDNAEYKEIKYLQRIVKIVEENLLNEIRNRSELHDSIQMAENNILKELKNRVEFQQMLKNSEDRIIKDLGNKTEQVYFQLDGLISIYKILEDVKYPVPPFRGWAVSPDFTRILMKYIFDMKPGLVVELGSGVSTIITGYCLKMNGKGKLISLEHEENYYRDSLKNIKAHGLEGFVELYYAPLKQYPLDKELYSWYDLSKVPIDKPVDIITVDGPPGTIQKESRYPAFPLMISYLNHKAIILVDDYIREDEKEMVKKWLSNTQLEQVDIFNTEKGTCVLRYHKPE
jgi:predicted O-methyltransferase YrrM